MQHGEALAEEVDPERSLSPQGERDSVSMSRFLEGEIAPRVIFHSGKRRAEQTALLMAAGLVDAVVKRAGNIGPKDPVEPLLSAIRAWHQETLLVGHLPFLASLVSQLLVGRDTPPLVSFQPGTLVALERSAGGHWSLLWMVRAELLHN